MQLSRIDLDGSYSPLGLVTKILAAEPNLTIPVPVEDVARALDIAEINEIETDGFLGGLITDAERSSGGILVQTGIGRKRRRFTIAHELGHFLIPYHKPVNSEKFMCDRAAMRAWDTKTQDRYFKMEAEANRFGANLLMPPPHVRRFLGSYAEPSLQTIIDIHEEFDVSKEAAARCYVDHYGEKLAVIIARDGKIARFYTHREFPWLCIRRGQNVPIDSRYHAHRGTTLSPLMSTGAEHWIETDYGQRVPFMKEQILPQANGFAMILLWLNSSDDEFDPEEDMTARERYRSRMSQYGD